MREGRVSGRERERWALSQKAFEPATSSSSPSPSSLSSPRWWWWSSSVNLVQCNSRGMPSSVPRKSSSLWLTLGPTEVGIGHHLTRANANTDTDDWWLIKGFRALIHQMMKLVMIGEEKDTLMAVLRLLITMLPLCDAIIKSNKVLPRVLPSPQSAPHAWKSESPLQPPKTNLLPSSQSVSCMRHSSFSL